MAIIHIPNSSIFDSKAQTLVNPVNCVGVMGKGLAAEFKRQFPEMFQEYRSLCDQNKVVLGTPYLSGPWDAIRFEKEDNGTSLHIFPVHLGRYIVNFPTKLHWRDKSYLSSIANGLENLRTKAVDWGLTSLAVPALGCGNGNLLWRDVRSLIHQMLGKLPFDVEVYLPTGAEE